MTSHLRYLWYVLRHKWYVLVAGCVLGVPLGRLLAHDLSKFSPAEWGPYVRRFYGGRGQRVRGILDFPNAWDHHKAHNPHHPEFWTLTSLYRLRTLDMGLGEWLSLLLFGWHNPIRMGLLQAGTIDPVPMPDTYIREMVADWYGAGMANGKPDCWAWYRMNRDRYPILPEAHAAVERYLLMLTDAGLITSEFAGPDPTEIR